MPQSESLFVQVSVLLDQNLEVNGSSPGQLVPVSEWTEALQGGNQEHFLDFLRRRFGPCVKKDSVVWWMAEEGSRRCELRPDWTSYQLQSLFQPTSFPSRGSEGEIPRFTFYFPRSWNLTLMDWIPSLNQLPTMRFLTLDLSTQSIPTTPREFLSLIFPQPSDLSPENLRGKQLFWAMDKKRFVQTRIIADFLAEIISPETQTMLRLFRPGLEAGHFHLFHNPFSSIGKVEKQQTVDDQIKKRVDDFLQKRKQTEDDEVKVFQHLFQPETENDVVWNGFPIGHEKKEKVISDMVDGPGKQVPIPDHVSSDVDSCLVTQIQKREDAVYSSTVRIPTRQGWSPYEYWKQQSLEAKIQQGMSERPLVPCQNSKPSTEESMKGNQEHLFNYLFETDQERENERFDLRTRHPQPEPEVEKEKKFQIESNMGANKESNPLPVVEQVLISLVNESSKLPSTTPTTTTDSPPIVVLGNEKPLMTGRATSSGFGVPETQPRIGLPRGLPRGVEGPI